MIVALNKIDTIDAELVEALSAELEAECGHKVYALSAAANIGLEPVLDALLGHLDDAKLAAIEVSGDEDRPWSPL